MGTNHFLMDRLPDPYPLFILLCNPFPDPDTKFVIRSLPDSDHNPDPDIIYIFIYVDIIPI